MIIFPTILTADISIFAEIIIQKRRKIKAAIENIAVKSAKSASLFYFGQPKEPYYFKVTLSERKNLQADFGVNQYLYRGISIEMRFFLSVVLHKSI